MEKVLKLYTYVNGVNDTPFPDKEQQVITSDFRSDYKRMGGVPTISCTIVHPLCLDKLWTDNVYATFNGEKFFIKQIPTSSYDNTDARYKHELELVSERIILDNVYVYDVVTSDTTNDKPVSNSSKFVFFGTIHEFAERLNYSLQYSGLDYRVVVDEGISSEGKMVSFENQFFSNAIQESYNTYEIPYYYVGKVIHIGFTDNAITHTFKYGQDESLLSIQKQNANYKIVNRVTGVGSSDNIPYYYPNDYESKEEVEANGGTWINPQTNLMPPIYRDTLGAERFYKALNNTYISPQTGNYYEFENPFIEGKPKEHIVNFDNIKPSIVGMVNSNGLRIDMFSEFAYDLNDNDETDDEGNYLHPYFFGKLRKFDGEFGFNLFDHTIDEDEMVISMTSGNCGACEFVIGVDEDTQKNPVQVDASGNLKRDSDGNVIRSGAFQDRQNDTQNYEVWIALKKDINTFGVIMPNATNNYRPSTNDTFVILHIDLPKSYILAAEDKLKEELIKYMAMNNSEKFNFSITFSRIFFAENPDILAQLNENARIQIEYDNELYELYVSSYSYNMSSDKPLPEIKVELSDTLTVTQNALQTAISEVKKDIMSSTGSIDWLQQGLRRFLRKDTNDRTRGKLSTDVAFEVGKFVAGASGAIIQVDKNTGQTVAELDKLYVRMKAYFETLEIINVNSVGGKMILSPAGSVTCMGVEELEDAYRCYFLGEQDGEMIENRFKSGDQAFSQMFNAKVGVSNKVSNHYYWRLVTSASEDVVDYNNQKCHYIDLSKTDCDSGSDIPKSGDVINHRGSRYDTDRMNFIEFSSVGVNAPYITLFQGVNSYSLANKDYVSYGYDQSTGKAYMNVYGDMYVGDRNETSYMRYTQEDGLEVKGRLTVGTTYNGSELGALFDRQQEDLEKFSEAVIKEFENIRNEMDGAIDTWFGEETPTLDNYPASDWVTNSDKDSHLGDLFYTNDGKAYRFQYTEEEGYYWAAITDSEVVKALELAQKALDTADGKRRVFIEQPYPPYDLGDLWAGGESQPLMRCINARESGSYYESDWALADNTKAYADAIKKALEESIEATKSELDQAIIDAEEASKGYTDEAKAEIQQSIDAINEAKADIDDVYNKATIDGLIDDAEASAILKANEVAQAERELLETRVNAYADGQISEAEQRAIDEAQARVDKAKGELEEEIEALDTELHELVNTTASNLNEAITNAETAAKSYTDEAKQALQASIGELESAKANIADVYNKSQADDIISQAEADAISAAKQASDAAIAASEVIIKAYADGIVDEEEQARIKQAQENLETAKAYAEQKAKEAFDDAMTELSSYEYLKAALGDAQATEIEQGLILTSLIQMRDTDGLVKSGLNGITSVKGDKSIASWWGGEPNDLADYYNWNGNEWVAKSGVTIPSNIPSGLIRFDGTGYFAKGKFWWDDKGEIHADPTALLLSFDVETGDETLAATIIDIRKKLAYWELKEDANGNKYLSTSMDIVTSGGVTMYAQGGVNIPSIIDSLPIASTTVKGIAKFDSNYFSVGSDGLVTFIGSTGGGTADSVHWDNVEGKPTFATVATSGKYSDLSGVPTLVSSFTNDAGYLTSHQTIYNLTMQAGTFSAKTFDPNGAAMTVNIPTTTSHISEGTNLYFTNARAVSALSSTLAGYLPLSGGTLTSTLSAAVLTLKRTHNTGATWIDFYNNTGLLGAIGIGGSGSPVTGDLFFHNPTLSKDFKVWHEGNDGSGSGLDADTLDSVQLSGIKTTLVTYLGTIQGAIETTLYGETLGYNEDKSFRFVDTKFYSSISTTSNRMQVAYGYDTDIVQYRRYYNGWQNWKTLAFTDGNVASATKLQTARTIWGQSFNGTGDITGSLLLSTSDQINGTTGLALNYNSNANVDVSIYNGMKTKIAVFKSAGHLGLGTNNPAYRLEAIGAIGSTTVVGGEDAGFDANGINYRLFFGVGTGNTSRGIYDRTHGHWWIYRDSTTNTLIPNGNVGIGTTSPTTGFDVKKQSLEIGVSVYGSGGVASQISMSTHREGSSYCVRGMQMSASGSATGIFQSFLINSINYGTKTNLMSLDSSGNGLFYGGVTMYSDIRKKTKLQDVELSLKQIADAPLIEHYYNSDDKKTTHVGSIAQYWAGMNDWFCKQDNEGYYTMEIQNAALASAISVARHLQKYESKTDKKIRMLKKRISELEDKIEELEHKSA